MALEALGIPGIGLLFAGISAIIVGSLMLAGLVDQDAYILQFSLWFLMTALCAALLWKPLRRWHGSPARFSNMVGSTATVTGGALRRGTVGKAKWSGTTMNAELDPHAAVEEIPDGARAEICDVRGTVLILRPHHPDSHRSH